jgi:hypothetical protein
MEKRIMWNFKNKQSTQSKMKTSNKGPVLLAAMLGFLFAYPAIQTSAHEEGVDTHNDTIEVHGDWVVTVSNPDGSIAQQRSFKNALVTPGLLVGLVLQASNWNILPSGTIWFNSDSTLPWYIEVATSGVDTDACQADLTVDYSQWGGGSEKAKATASAVSSSSFTLTRTLALPLECVTGESYSINGVSTAFIAWAVGAGGAEILDSRFTEKTLSTPITGILPDQVVKLIATISFE